MATFSMKWVPDKEHYGEQMERIVAKILDPIKESGYVANGDGQELYYEIFRPENPVGKVVIVHGFTEILPKYYEAASYFVRGGLAVYMMQQAGHGKSYRYMENKDAVHITSWQKMVDNLDVFIEEKVVADEKTVREDHVDLPIYIFSHSMGGGTSACYLEQHPGVVEKGVLSSPMLEVNAAVLSTKNQIALSHLMVLRGLDEEPSLGAQTFEESGGIENSASQGEARYEFVRKIQEEDPQYQGNYATWLTANNFAQLCDYATNPLHVRKVDAKILLFSAENDTLVRKHGQDKFMRHVKDGKMIIAPGCKHEIFTSDDRAFLKIYWNKIFKFYGI